MIILLPEQTGKEFLDMENKSFVQKKFNKEDNRRTLKMKKYFNMTKLFSIALLGTSLLVHAGCGNKNEEKAAAKTNTAKVDSVSVITSAVQSKTLQIKKVYTGTLEGEQQANIVSQLAERIAGIPVRVGSVVRAGQVVVRLDKGGVTSQYYQAQSNLRNIEKNYNRMKTLFETGAVSRQQFDEVETGYEIAKANFNAARNAVEITAPISGVVTDIKHNVGDFTSPGAPIMTIARVSTLKLIMSVGEADIPYVKSGQKVKIFSDLNPSVIANGRITEISRSADLSTRTFEVKASFPNQKEQWFKPGMFAKAELDLTAPKEMSIVPREAVIYSEEGPKVFVVQNNKAVERRVKTGMQNETEVEITEGLSNGEVVVRSGMNNLKDGSIVIVSSDSVYTQN